jgi:hypothetical protein
MKRLIISMINNRRPRTEKEEDQHKLDMALWDTIDEARPPPPADRKFPPDEATKVWLNAALDAEMKKKDLESAMHGVEKAIDRANQEAPPWDEFVWMVAIKDQDRLLELLRNPPAAIPRWMGRLLADRIEGRGRGQPRKSQAQRVEDSKEVWAARDFYRLKSLLVYLYPECAKRRGKNGVRQYALEIAKMRWRPKSDGGTNGGKGTLETFIDRSRNSRSRPHL